MDPISKVHAAVAVCTGCSARHFVLALLVARVARQELLGVINVGAIVHHPLVYRRRGDVLAHRLRRYQTTTRRIEQGRREG